MYTPYHTCSKAFNVPAEFVTKSGTVSSEPRELNFLQTHVEQMGATSLYPEKRLAGARLELIYWHFNFAEFRAH